MAQTQTNRHRNTDGQCNLETESAQQPDLVKKKKKSSTHNQHKNTQNQENQIKKTREEVHTIKTTNTNQILIRKGVKKQKNVNKLLFTIISKHNPLKKHTRHLCTTDIKK